MKLTTLKLANSYILKYLIPCNIINMKKNLYGLHNKSKLLILTVLVMQFLTSTSKTVNTQSNLYVDKTLQYLQTLANDNAQHMDCKSFNLFSHAKPGYLLINDQWLNAEQIVDFLKPKLLNNIQHVNIYGCEFAKGKDGKAAVKYIEKHMGISVSASTNITGKDGDWILEYNPYGHESIVIQNYNGNLQCANFGTGPSQDYDCDGVINSIDIDDDNDGIRDVDECTQSLTFSNNYTGSGDIWTTSYPLGGTVGVNLNTAYTQNGTNVTHTWVSGYPKSGNATHFENALSDPGLVNLANAGWSGTAG